MQKQTFTISGLTCQACKKITEKRIGLLPGVGSVEVTVVNGQAVITSENKITSIQINEVLKGTPYFIGG